MKTLYLSLLFLGLSLMAFSQTVTRGPYMQSPNHESIIIMWRTDSNTDTKVWYGTDSTNLSQTAVISNNVKDHSIVLTGLQAYTTYYYKIGNNAGQFPGIVSKQSFKTHPTPGTKNIPMRMWAIGDFGKGNSLQVDVKNSYEAYTGSRGTDVWICLGDNAYDSGEDVEYQAKVFNLPGFSNVFNYQPFWPSPGNHDYNEVWAESTFLGIPYQNIPLTDHEGPYYDMVSVPKFGEVGGYPSQLEVFYSFDYGDVHFLSLNSEVFDYTFSYDGINAMKQWILQDLQQNTKKFTIAYFHQPPYSKGSHDSDDFYELAMKAMREKVIPILEQNGVDMVINGHSHVYERSVLINGHYGASGSYNPATMAMDAGSGNIDLGEPYIKDTDKSTQDGTIYVVCGNSGSSTSSPAGTYPAMYYSDGGSNTCGSFIIDVYKNRLDGRYLKTDTTIGDYFTILKKDLKALAINDVTICEGETVDFHALYSGGSDSITYAWTNTTLTDSSVTLAPVASTNYELYITDNLTGQIDTSSFAVTVTPVTTPVINEVIAGSTLAADLTGSQYSYQWYISGVLLTGATNQYFQPQIDGDYTVVVTNNTNNCSSESAPFLFEEEVVVVPVDTDGDGILDQDEDINNDGDLTNDDTDGDGIPNYLDPIEDAPTSITGAESLTASLFPNPASGEIVLQLSSNLKGESYQILDVFGRIIMVGEISGFQTKINLKGLAKGSYLLELNDGKNVIYKNFIKK